MLLLICLICLCLFINDLRLKRFYSINVYIFFGIILPLFLYTLNWSSFIVEEKSYFFIYTFISLTLLLLIYYMITIHFRLSPVQNEIEITRFGRKVVGFINPAFVILYLLENYIGSGLIFPTFSGVDIHAYSAPMISYITTSFYTVFVMDYLTWKATKKNKYLFWIAVICLIPLITRASRMQVLISLVSLVSFVFFVESSYAKYNILYKEYYKKIKKTTVFVSFIFIAFAVALTTFRMNQFGVYEMSYAREIGYTGPEWMSFLAPYYGYFPLSFNNLNVNMMMKDIEHNYLGLYSFLCFYYGIFQLDNLFDINPYQSIEGNYSSSTAATVPTGFWEYYYDFGMFLFIPILLALIISYLFFLCASREKTKLTYRVLYFWYIPLWFFTSFQNVLFSSTLIVSGCLLAFLINRSFYTNVKLMGEIKKLPK